MESRILNVSAARTAPTSAHFGGARRTHAYVGGGGGNYQGLCGEKAIRSLQYSIPAVGHHYGNAFDDDEDDDDEADEVEGCRNSFVASDAYGQPMLASTTDGEYYDEDGEEVDEDVEMSPAIEVISIDPNCDYDSEEEEEEEEEVEEEQVVEHVELPMVVQQRQEVEAMPEQPQHQFRIEAMEHGEETAVVQGETVSEENVCAQVEVEEHQHEVIEGLESDDIEPELENIHHDSEEEGSDDDSSSSNSSSGSGSSSDSDSNSSRKNNNSSRSSSSSSSGSRTGSSASSHPSDYVNRSDQEEEKDADAEQQENLAKVIERRKLMAIERRKQRNSSVNRKSFSLPHSPVAGRSGGSLMHDMTSLSFEDLDVSAIVNDLSPLKGLPVRASESDDKLVREMAENNFDLAAYITEDDFVTTDSEKQRELPKQAKTSPVKKQPKSRGKQLKMLRELMISPKTGNKQESTGGTRRSCTNKTRQIVDKSDSDSDDSESDGDGRQCVKIFGIERMIGKPKRKEDDTKADPTWNPNGVPTGGKNLQRAVHCLKSTAAATTTTTTTPATPSTVQQQPSKPENDETKRPSAAPVKANEPSKPTNASNNKNKLLSAGSQLARNKMLSLMAKHKHPVQHTNKQKSNQSKPAEKPVEPPKPAKQPPVISSKNNIKLDHDYCSPKKGVSSQQSGSLAAVPQRKAIEIPFLLPTMDQLRQKKKLSKIKKKADAAPSSSSSKNSKTTGDDCDKKSHNIVKVEETKQAVVRTSNDVKHVVSTITAPPIIVKKEVVIEEEPVAISATSIVKIERMETKPATQQQQQPPTKQVSLLKINLNKPNGVQTAPPPMVVIPMSDEKLKSEQINASNSNCTINAASSSSSECAIKIKKKLNLQEYKKRRELPPDESTSCLSILSLTESSSLSSITSSSTTISECSSKEGLASQPQQAEQNEGQEQQQTKSEPVNRVPLDPISAAKLKALRTQQLKKEAAIKSSEAKIIPKTVPRIVPLAEITSIKFDEHGNPVPYDKDAEREDANGMKLHADFEEIIIVSMGCNTEITINPNEANQDTLRIKNSSPSSSSTDAASEKNIPKNELLSDITDTIKRCQSAAPAIISSCSLISSIHEVVIKKKSCIKTDTSTAAAVSDKRSIEGGQANQQGSPNIGVSPPNAFSPGKPEKAGGIYDQSPSFDYDEGQLQQTQAQDETTPAVEHGEDKIIMHLRKDRQRFKGVSIGIQTLPLDRFPDLKRLSPVKKERTVSRSSCGSAQRSHSRQSAADAKSRDRSRRQYRRRRSRSSSSDSTENHRNRSVSSYRGASSSSKRPSSRRSRSRCSSRRRSCSRSRSRSYRHRSRSDSHRRRSSVSSERRRYYERDYAQRRDRSNRRRRRSRSSSSQYSSSSCSSSYSRSRSRSSRSRSRSRSVSRPSSRGRNPVAQQECRRAAAPSPERKIVYVGRLEPALRREDLKRKFMQYGRIKQVTLHYKESGAKYGFVTFEKPQDAYRAIDSSAKDPALSEYDVSFGGRRAFCRTEYADLDGDLSQDLEPVPYIAPDGSLLLTTPIPTVALPRKDEPESFEDMLKKLRKDIIAKKPRNS